MSGLPDLTLKGFIAALAADRPAPGSGAAGAASLALGAACAAKAFRICARRHGGDPALAAAADESEAIAGQALDMAEREAGDFAALLHARGPDQAAPKVALRADGEDLIALSEALRALVAGHQGATDRALLGDLAAALAFLEACEAIQRRNLGEL